MPAYSKPPDEYFEKRTLRRHARVLHLWALGVAAVISGDFFGWNFGLTAGGFSGMLTALVIMTAMYAGDPALARRLDRDYAKNCFSSGA